MGFSLKMLVLSISLPPAPVGGVGSPHVQDSSSDIWESGRNRWCVCVMEARHNQIGTVWASCLLVGSIPFKTFIQLLFIHLHTFNLFTLGMLSPGQASGETCPKLSPHYHSISKVVFKCCHFPPCNSFVLLRSHPARKSHSKTGKGSVLVEVGVRFMEPVHSVFPSAVLSSYVTVHDSGKTPFRLGTKN